jgi:hypothetical protein
MIQCHQPPEGVDRDLDRLAQWHGLASGVAIAIGEDEAQHDQRCTEQETRSDPCHEQANDRDRAAGGERINHRVVARRDEQCLHRGADRHIGGKDARVAGLLHLRDHHRPDRRSVGHRGARNPAQKCGGKNIDHRQPATNAGDPDQHVGERHQPPCHAALGHDGAGEHKKRDRQHCEFTDPARHLEHHRFERDTDPISAGKRPQTERVGNRHTESKADEECPDDDQDFHPLRLP